MVTTNQIRDEYRMEYVSVGADKVASDASRVASATDGVSVATEKQERRVLTLTSAVERFNARNDALYRMQQQLERGQGLLNRAMDNGLGDTEAYRRGVEILTQQQQRYVQMSERAAAANSNVKAGLDAATAAAARAAAGWAALSTQGAATLQGLDVARRMGSASAIATPGMDLSSLRGLRSEIDPIWAAQEKLNKSLADANKLRQAGLVSQEAYAGYVARAAQAHDDLTRKIQQQATASQRAAAAAELQARQAQEQTTRLYAGGYQRAIDRNIGIRPPSTAEQAGDREQGFIAAAEAADRLRAKYDPLFAAQKTYRADLGELRSALSAGILTEDAYSAALGRKKAAFAEQVAGLGRVSAAQREMTAAAERAQAVGDRTARGWAALSAQGATTAQSLDVARRMSMSSAVAGPGEDASLNQTRAAIDPVWSSQDRLNKSLAGANRLRKDGLVTEAAYTRYVTLQREAHADVVKKTAANQNGRLDAQGGMNLFYQGSDVFTQASMGTNPLLIAAQQGPQLAQSFVGPGSASISGALDQAKEAVTGFTSRIGLMGLAIGTVATAVTTATAAAYAYSEQQRNLDRSTRGAGRASGATLQDLNEAAQAASATGNLSTSYAQDVVADLNRTGRISPQVYAPAAGSLKDLAREMGTEMPEAARMLAQGLPEPVKLFDELNKVLGLGGAQMRDRVKDAQELGDTFKAQSIVVDAYTQKLREMSDQGTVGRLIDRFDFWRNTSQEFSGIGGAVYRALGNGTLEEQRTSAQERLSNLQERAAAGRVTVPGSIEREQAAVAQLDAAIKAAAEKSREARDNLRSLDVQPLLTSLNPATRRLTEIERQAESIRKDLREAGSDFDRDGRMQRAADGLSAAARQLRSDLEAGGTAFADSLRSAKFQERTSGYAPTALSAAQIDEEAANRRLQALRESQFDTDTGMYDRRLRSIEEERELRLSTLRKQTESSPGQYYTNIGQVPEQYRTRVYGAAVGAGIDPSLLASIFRKETGGFREDVISGRRLSPAGAIGPFQFMPGTARERGVDPLNFDAAAKGAAELIAERIRARGGSVATALGDYNAGPGRMNRVLAGQSTLPAETRDYINTIMSRPADMGQQAKEQEARVRQLQQEREELRLTTEAGGKDAEGLRARIEASRLVAAEQMRSVEVSGAYQQQLRNEAVERQKLLTEGRLFQFASDTAFEREQLGRTDLDARAYARARSYVGDTDSDAAKLVISQSRLNDQLRLTKDLSREALGGLVSDLRRGADFGDALTNALNRLADRLTDLALDQALSAVFKGSGGASGSGFFATIGSALFGSSGAATGYVPGFAVGRLPSYAGGLSTRASVDAAGVIHGPGSRTSDSILALMNDRNPIRISDEEAIIRADSVAYYGPSIIRAINERRLDRDIMADNAMPRHATGRIPERPRMAPLYMPPPAQAAPQSSGPSEVKLSVVNESGYPVQAEAREVPDGRGGRKQGLVLVNAVADAVQSPKVQAAMRQPAVAQR